MKDAYDYELLKQILLEEIDSALEYNSQTQKSFMADMVEICLKHMKMTLET